MLKYRLDSLNDVEEAHKALYTEQGGKYVLQVEGVADQTELERFKAKALQAEGEAIDRRKALDPYKALGTPEEITAKLAEKNKGNPDHDNIVAQLKTDYEAKLTAAQQRITTMRAETDTANLKAELLNAGFMAPDGNDASVQMVAQFALSQRIQYDDDGNQRILAVDGNTPMIGNAPNGGATIKDLASDLAKAMPHLVSDGGKGGSGKQPNSNGGTPTKKWNEMDSSEKVALHRENPAEYERVLAASNP